VTTRICIADDHPLFGDALEALLSARMAELEILRVSDVGALQETVSRDDALSLLLLDLHMPGAVGFSSLSWIRRAAPQLPVVIISANTHPTTVRRALDHGAAGFLSKSADAGIMIQCLEAALAGETGLHPELQVATTGESLQGLDVAEAVASMTTQQFKVASMLVEGQLNKQIAWELGVKEATIKAHMTEIFRKLGVQSRTQAVLKLGQLMPATSEDHESPLPL
jgi:DNA-binding NarL/FixJ family response regulator